MEKPKKILPSEELKKLDPKIDFVVDSQERVMDVKRESQEERRAEAAKPSWRKLLEEATGKKLGYKKKSPWSKE